MQHRLLQCLHMFTKQLAVSWTPVYMRASVLVCYVIYTY